MRPLYRRRCALRTPRFEPCEPRLVMSGLATTGLSLEYFVDDPAAIVTDQTFWEAETSLANAHDLTGLTEARREFGLTGAGQTVVVIDTGIAYDHLALGGGFGSGYRVIGGFDFTEEYDADPYDDGPLGSHGTHVAGIIAGSDGTNPGVAPGVDLVALRVFNDDGDGYFDWIEDALQWVHNNLNTFDNPITTVNLSIGTDYNGSAPPSWSMIEDELAQLEADGLFISVAAGNGFDSFGTTGLSYPAASPYVVPVASVDDNGQLSYFSQRNDRVIAAPGRSITSTVPDYLGNYNGVADDFASFSGTSMAAPYVAGASVLLREAYAFVGVGNVTQDDLYALMRSTADSVYDAATGQSYCRLNLQRALEAILPSDEFGSYAYDAENLGSLGSSDDLSASGIVNTLDDDDFFRFTAEQTGRVTVAYSEADELVSAWDVVGTAFTVNEADGTLSFEAVAGQTYTIGLGTQAGIGHYTLDISLEADFLPPDADAVRQMVLADQSVSAAGRWFAFTAAQNGILTVDASFSGTAGDVDLQLFDSAQRLIGGSYGVGDTERIDVIASAGDTFYVYAYTSGAGTNPSVDLRITNMVAQSGAAVTVTGTDGDDTFVFTAGTTHEIVVNGVSYRFDARTVDTVAFDGLGGSNTATLTGDAGADTAKLTPGGAELAGQGYTVTVAATEDVTVNSGGGGADVAFLYDSAGDDVLIATPSAAHLFGPGFSSRAVGFRYAHAYARARGSDIAYLHDSAGNDVFVATPVYGTLYGDNFLCRAKHFEAVHAYATRGGDDTAYFYGSAGDDHFESTPIYSRLSGQGYLNRAKYFEDVQVRGGNGGTDRAQLVGSQSNDQLTASGNTARLTSTDRTVWLQAFSNISAYAVTGGHDRAEIAAVDYLLRLLGDWQ